MGRSAHCTPAERGLIKKLRSDGKSYAEIREVVKCSNKMIANALKWSGKPETRGRKRKLSDKAVRNLLRKSKKNPFVPATVLKEELCLPVSTSTVKRRLRDANLFARSPRKVPLLKKIHLKNRLQFAKDHVDWPVSKWRNILWSDESKIVLFGFSGRRSYVRRPALMELNPRYTVKTIKHGGGKINAWACFSYFGVGPIHRIDGLMNAAMYVNI